jgi:hypothetical protein
MGKPSEQRSRPARRSSYADAAAIKWADEHPDEDVEHEPPSSAPEPEDGVPNRHSASAEAAALRHRDEEP